MSAVTLGAVVCAYSDQRRTELSRAIESLLAQSREIDELVLVIDHNVDLLRYAEGVFASRGVNVIANAGKRGLSGARNTGVAACSTDAIAFLDDDAVADPGWAAKIAAAYADPAVIGAGGSIEPLWESAEPRWFPREFLWVVGCTYVGMPEARADVRNLIGANMSLRRDVFERAGTFSTEIGRVGKKPVGCEETELCIRALAAIPDSRIVYEPSARVDHLVTVERAKWKYFRQRCYSEGISKAQVVRMAGSGQGLASERTYSTRVLPVGVLRGLAGPFRAKPSGLLRAAAIIAGLLITTSGFVRGRFAPLVLDPLENSHAGDDSR